MAIKIHPFLLITLLSFLISFSLFNVSIATTADEVSAASTSTSTSAADVYRPLDPTAPEVYAAGTFAVDEYNKKENKTAQFHQVFRAAGQDFDAGQEFGGKKFEYALVIDGEEDNVPQKYAAVVQEDNNFKKELVAFRTFSIV